MTRFKGGHIISRDVISEENLKKLAKITLRLQVLTSLYELNFAQIHQHFI